MSVFWGWKMVCRIFGYGKETSDFSISDSYAAEKFCKRPRQSACQFGQCRHSLVARTRCPYPDLLMSDQLRHS